MKKTLILIAALLTSFGVLAQKGKVHNANTNYEGLAFMDAVSIYEKVADKGYGTTEIYQKLGNSYYFNGDYINASKWYEKLFDAQDASIDSEYYYRYSQVLKSVGDSEKSNQYLKMFSDLKPNDKRSILYKENKNYLNEILKNSERHEITDSGLNSKMSDFGTGFYLGNIVFASSRSGSEIHTWTNQPYTDLYFAELDSLGKVKGTSKFDKKINSKLNESSAVFTKDGNTMYFTRNNIIESKLGKSSENAIFLKIFRAKKNVKTGKWEDVESLPFNSDDFNTAHPALSPDESYLYFASNRSGGFGESDLYRVKINGDSFGSPENLGDKINTPAKETFPFVSADNELFFASDGHLGLGGLDVFAVKIKDNRFLKVQNVGKPVNSEFDDFAYVITYDKQLGFFSSNRTSGKGYDDIYKFKELKRLQLDCESSLKGIVTDAQTDAPIFDVLVELYNEDNKLIASTKSKSDGSYSFLALDCDTNYLVKIIKDEFDITEESFITSTIPNGIINKDKKLTRRFIPITKDLDLAKVYGIENIYFELDKWNITKQAEEKLNVLLTVMEEHPTIKIDVRSHTDCRQTAKYNELLSDKRAKSTIAWLVKKGIAANRLAGRGYGESQLVNDCACEPTNKSNCTEAEHQKNRRSEFIIVK